MCSQRDNGGGARSVVIGSGVEYLPAQVAKMIVMCRENVTAVVAFAFDLGNYVK